MSSTSWRLEELELEPGTGSPEPALVSLHFLLTALRRRWRVWVCGAAVGMLLGLTYAVVVPPASTGTVTVLLSHDPLSNPDQAIATDLSMLQTRAVAGSVIQQLDLHTTPEAFLQSVTPTQLSTSVLVLEVTAPDDQAAVARARALSATFLGFRADQIRAQTKALVEGYQRRVDALQKELDALTVRYDALSGGGPEAERHATDLLSKRSEVGSEINSLRTTIQDTVLQSRSIIAASHVLDAPSPVPYSATQRTVLAAGSGLIGGGAIGVALVLFTALTSDRLRRRDEIALALEAPVRVSVGSLHPSPWARISRRRSAPSRNLQVLLHALEPAVTPRKSSAARVALAAVDNTEDAELVLGTLAVRLARRGQSVFVVDLSERGGLDQAIRSGLERGREHGAPADTLTVFRPEGVPSLSRGPIGASGTTVTDLPKDDPRRPAWESAQVVLVLAEVDPAIGIDHLKSWVSQVVLLVTAGRSGVERLRTTADLVRRADVRLPFAMLVGADPRDESLGVPDALNGEWAEARRPS